MAELAASASEKSRNRGTPLQSASSHATTQHKERSFGDRSKRPAVVEVALADSGHGKLSPESQSPKRLHPVHLTKRTRQALQTGHY